MQITDPNVEAYCGRHSSAPSELARELQAYTQAHCELPQMIVGDLVSSTLQFLVAITGAKRVLEIGCFTGYSALAMAEALPADGELLTLDVNEDTNRIAREFWSRSPHGRKVRSIVGDAHQTLAGLVDGADSPPRFDLVFIDADKEGYRDYFDRSLGLLSERGFIVLDNSLMGGGVLEPKDAGSRAVAELNAHIAERVDLVKVLLPVRDGLMMVRRLPSS